MLQDYQQLSEDQIEAVEKQTLRTIVQALQEYSREAKQIFDTTVADSDTEVIVLAEDLVQYALEVAECYPINKRFAGFIDYKRVRWLSTPFAMLPQALLVDAKASTENNRDTLQQSQLPMDAEFRSNKTVVRLAAGVPPHLPIPISGGSLFALTTSILVHFYYEDLGSKAPPFRTLKAIYALSLPHSKLKRRYNPNADETFFGQGKHSPARGEAQRIRVYFGRLRAMCPWRLQELRFAEATGYTTAVWRDVRKTPTAEWEEYEQPFAFIGR